MGEGNLNAAIGHIVLCCVAARGISKLSGKNYTNPGMHANFFVHGIFGFLNNQSGLLNNDFAQIYGVTLKASKYLALPCLMADLYKSKQEISLIHLVSGLVPFVLALTGKDNVHLGNVMIACNIVSLIIFSVQNNRTYGYYTAAAGIFAYFMTPNTGDLLNSDFAQIYEISQKASRYLALPCLMADLYKSRLGISLIHLVSGVVPFTLAWKGKDNIYLGSMMIACNIVSLIIFSVQNDRIDGYYTAAGCLFSYFLTPLMGEIMNNNIAQIYGITLKASRYLALPCLMADLYKSRHGISLIHLVSGVVPFALALTGKDNIYLGNLMIACNIVSLIFYSVQHKRTYGIYMAAGGFFAYFLTPQLGENADVIYPLSLAVMESCAYNLFFSHFDLKRF